MKGEQVDQPLCLRERKEAFASFLMSAPSATDTKHSEASCLTWGGVLDGKAGRLSSGEVDHHNPAIGGSPTPAIDGVRAGRPEPQFGEQAGAAWVRFVPSGYIASHRIAHDLTERHRAVLQVLSKFERLALREIRERLDNSPPERSLREDLQHLKRLGLVDTDGHGRGATWYLIRT